MAITLIYCLFVFRRINKLVIYQKRYPKMVVSECILAIIAAIFIWPMFAFYGARPLNHHNKQNINELLFFISYPYFGHAITSLEACRLWSMYYKINYMNAVSNCEWQSVIDNTTARYNWFLNNTKTYGNIKWICIRWFGYYVFAATTSMIVIIQFTFRDFTQFIDLCLYA
eukprot:184696_1